MTNELVIDLDQEIVHAAARMAELTRLKAAQDAASRSVWLQSELKARQDNYLASEAARLASIREAFEAVALPAIAASLDAQSEASAQWVANAAKLDQMIADAQKFAEDLRVQREKIVAARAHAAAELRRRFQEHRWEDLWLNMDPANPDGAAVDALAETLAGALSVDVAPELVSAPLKTSESNRAIVRNERIALQGKLEWLRSRREWADSALMPGFFATQAQQRRNAGL